MLKINKLLSKIIINSNINSKPARPFPFSMYSHKLAPKVTKNEENNESRTKFDLDSVRNWDLSEYTSWESLNNKSFSNRLLPPADKKAIEDLPPLEKTVAALIRKGQPMIPCHRSSILFMGFAQWFTDAFLRVDLKDIRKNTSNHEIDLCQIYGLEKNTTDLLRSKKGGRLKTQLINGKEFPPYLFNDDLTVVEEFKTIEYLDYLPDTYGELWKDKERRKKFFVTGLGRGNTTLTHSAINILFIRFHNKIAGLLEEKYNWDDERLFETTRNILITILIKLTIEDYVNHIKPFKWMRFELDTSFAEKKKWYRNNWISTEFNLAYRWHSLIPDSFYFNGKTQDTASVFRFNNKVIIDNDLSSIFNQMSFQKAGKITIANTPDFLYYAELSSLYISRGSRLMPFTAYKKEFRSSFKKKLVKEPVKKIEDITKNKKDQDLLKKLYGNDVHKIDLLVGLLAEEPLKSIFYNQKPILGDTMLKMIASDAFSHALTNPLLSKKVYNTNTFSALGMELIESFSTVKQVVDFVEETNAEVSFNYNDVTLNL